MRKIDFYKPGVLYGFGTYNNTFFVLSNAVVEPGTRKSEAVVELVVLADNGKIEKERSYISMPASGHYAPVERKK